MVNKESEVGLDTRGIPLGERAQAAIVAHILAIGDEAESNYLEVKSYLDLGQKYDLVKIAKFLLGAANRGVEEASRNFQGYAIMVLGASKDACSGVVRGTEHHELEDRLRPYLGPDLPPFELGRKVIDDEREVLFIVAPPPVTGQSIFPCHKDFHGSKGQERLDEGAIYVRGRSNTRPARPVEIQALVERARGGGKPPITLDVSVHGSISHVARIDDVMDLLYDHERDRYLTPQEGAGAANIEQILRQADGDGRRQSRLAEWLIAKDRHIADGINHLLGVSISGVSIAVVSKDRFVAKPHLTVRFDGCRLYDHLDTNDAQFDRLVEPVMKQADDPLTFSVFDASRYVAAPSGYPVEWYNTDEAAVVVLTPESFRPNAQWVTDDDDYVLVKKEAKTSSINVSWILTEDANDVVTTGSLVVAAGEPLDAGNLVRSFFLRGLD